MGAATGSTWPLGEGGAEAALTPTDWWLGAGLPLILTLGCADLDLAVLLPHQRLRLIGTVRSCFSLPAWQPGKGLGRSIKADSRSFPSLVSISSWLGPLL